MEWEMLLGLFYFNSQPHEEADMAPVMAAMR